MRQISYDLERKHNDLKNASVCRYAALRRRTDVIARRSYEDEITRLRRQIDSISVDNARTTLPPASNLNASGSGLSHLASSNPARPNLPPLASASSVRPASPPRISSATTAPTVGHGPSNLFGGGMSLPGASSDRLDHAYSATGEHPSKRMRSDDEERFKNRGTLISHS